MTDIKYDPELPFAFVGTSGEVVARFSDFEFARRFGVDCLVGSVVDTTPKPKVPEDAEFIIWEFEGETNMAYREDHDWYTSEGWWTTRDLEEALKDAEVTVLVRKEES